MNRYIVYDQSTGAVLATRKCPESEIGLNISEGQAFLEGELPSGPWKVDLQTLTLSPGKVDTRSIEQVRVEKRAAIDEWTIEANSAGFVYQDKLVATDTLSMVHLTNAALEIAKHGAMPVNWPGGWKAGGSFIPISTVAEWNSFHSAMYAQGLAHFNHAQALKALVNASSDREFIDSLTWNSV